MPMFHLIENALRDASGAENRYRTGVVTIVFAAAYC